MEDRALTLAMAKIASLGAENARLRAALQTLIDANDGNLSDVDGALYEARKALQPRTNG